MVALQDPALLLGGFSGLDLMMETPDPVTGARLHALGDDFELGDPEAVIAAVVSQWQDGDMERVDRYGNREAKIPLVIDAPGSDSPGDALAQMAARLDAACTFDGWTELVYVSPLAGSAPSVYEITTATVSAGIDDLAEIGPGERYVTLTLHARPWPRTADPVTIPAIDISGSTTTTVDDGSSVTGWSLLSTAPDPTANLEPNPSFESNATGWSAGGGSSAAARFTIGAYSGAGVLGVTPTTGGTRSYANGPTYIVIPGESYRVITAFEATSAGIRVRWYSDAAATAQVGSDWTAQSTSGSTAWRLTKFNTPAAPSGAIRMKVDRFSNTPSDPVLTKWFMDAVAVTPASTIDLGFFDGNTADTAAIAYAWDGIANNSTSTATWTTPSLAVVSGSVKGTVYGRSSASIRRAGTIDMSSLNYMRIKGTASAYSDGQVTVADNGGAALTTVSYSYNSTSGVYEILVKRPEGFGAVDVTFSRTGGTVSTTSGLFVAVDSIEITDAPFGTGKTQVRQVEVYGSQRTELSLSVLGLDAAGTTPVGLGEQALVYTAAAGSDGRAKFLACRAASGLAGTADATAVSGVYNTLNTTATPTAFTFPASTLLPGNYLVVARLKPITAGNKTISFRGLVTPTVGDPAYDPATAGWKTTPLTVASTGWPAVASGSYVLLPLGLLRLPPADLEDTGANIAIHLAASAASAVNVDDVFLLNADVGQASLLLTGLTSGSYSAVRLDAATVDSPQATAWVGVANGTMLADPARWIGEQHAASPGLLQIATVTPGCSTSRVSAHYYPRFHTHVVDLSGLLAA